MTESTPASVETPVRRPAPRPPSLLSAALRIFDLSLNQMLWSRRTIFMGLVVGLPVLISIVVRVFFEIGGPSIRVNRAEVTGPVVFGLMIWAFFVRFSVPVLGAFYGTALIADEIDDRTITYLFSRPIPRQAVLVGKFFAYVVCTVFVVLPSVVLIWLLIVPAGGRLADSFLDLLKDLGLLAAGLTVYGAVFAAIGAVFKRPLVMGLVFIFGWEPLALALPGDLGRLTVACYLQALVPHAMPADSPLGLLQAVFHDTPSLGVSLGMMAAITVAGVWWAARTVARREYVLEQ